jgi:transposase
MRGPKPLEVELSDTEEKALRKVVARHSTSQQTALRARIVLAAAEGLNNAEIARRLDLHVDRVRRWRRRWLEKAAISLEDLSVEERLADEPRSGAPARISAEQVCQIVALACELPKASGRPISQWTGREIADEIMRRGIVDKISERHAARLLKRGTFSHIDGAIG